MRPLSDQTKFILANPNMSAEDLARLGRRNGFPKLTLKKVIATRWRLRKADGSGATSAPSSQVHGHANGHANGHAKSANGHSASEAAFMRALWVIGIERAQQLIASVSNGH